MGDWSVADHFIIGDRPLPKPRWYDAKSWAMRVGVIGTGVRLMQTVEKWSCQRLSDDGVTGVCATCDYLDGGPVDSFALGWNYLVASACSDERLFRSVARELSGDAEVVSKGEQRVLCLRETRRFVRAHQTVMVAEVAWDESPLARFVRGNGTLGSSDVQAMKTRVSGGDASGL